MAVPGVEHGDAGCKVNELAAFDVPEAGVLGSLGKKVAHHADTARRGCKASVTEFTVGGHGQESGVIAEDLIECRIGTN
jgi:hypothetical protein